MRVLHVHKDFEPNRGGGGTARHIHGLASALSSRGCVVRVVAPEPEAVAQPYASYPGMGLRIVEHLRWADVVHVHGARSTYAVSAALLSHVLGKPFFYTPHAYYEGRSVPNAAAKWLWDKTAERFLLSKASVTILLTEYWRSFLRERGCDIARTVIIPNCVSAGDVATEVEGDVPRLSGAPAILSVGRLDPVKRGKDVIQAIARPELASAHFHVVGRGSDLAALQALANELRVSDRVIFHGFVSDADVARMVRGSDVFVLASEQEGLPTVLLEMLMAGLPVVCTRIPGNDAIMEVAGLDTSYEVGDVAGLSAQLLRAAGSAVPVAAIGALRRAFTWEERALSVLELYSHALARAAWLGLAASVPRRD